ncbi:MAG: hypothetical protein U0441_17840 [Polyangiaceae bacterium]
MPIVLRRALLLVPSIAALVVGCGPRPSERLRLATGGNSAPPAAPLSIAAEAPGERREVVVDARAPRTSLGHFRRGDRVRIRALSGKWTYTGGGEMVGPGGLGTSCVAPAPHVCAAGNGAAPGMGLLLFSRPDPEPPQCSPTHRFLIPNGVEMEIPESTHVFLAPNDREDGVSDNSGFIRVQVDLSPSKTAPIFQTQQVVVQANRARTSLGLMRAGTYLRVTVGGGTWQSSPGEGGVGAAGFPAEKCVGAGHACAGGENAPRMGLVFLMARCPDGGVPSDVEERKTFLGGDEYTDSVLQDGVLEVGPNDWEDGCGDNAGAVQLEVTTWRADRGSSFAE